MDDCWSISTGDGVSLAPEGLTDLLAVHHHRLIDTWQGLGPAQWAHQSRNTQWSVHDTVRHVADVMERTVVVANGGQGLNKTDFDPRSTPIAWLATSEGETPSVTIERFAKASASHRARISERFAQLDTARERTVYGTAHWTVNVVHVLWDSWLHERDVLIPLGLPADSSEGEERLVGLYGLLMALVPSMRMGQSVSSTIQLNGFGIRTLKVTCDARSLRSAEVTAAERVISGAMPAVIDALAGRGDAVGDLLPGAPEQLGYLAAFFNSSEGQTEHAQP